MPAGVFIVNFEHISHLVVVFAIVNFEHVISSWDGVFLQSLLTRIGGLNVGKCKPGKSLRGKGEVAWVGRGELAINLRLVEMAFHFHERSCQCLFNCFVLF